MEKIQRELSIKAFHINQVEIDNKTSIRDGVLTLPQKVEYTSDIFESVEVKVIPPNARDIYVNTIMDIVPISTKVLGILGEGITHTLTGVYLMPTGADTEGKQMHEFGSSEGILSEQLVFNKAGSPRDTDYIVHVDMILKAGQSYTREVATEMFRVADSVIQPLREILKMLNGRDADEVHVYQDKIQTNKPKVAIVKEVAGQGAMYDNLLFPKDPSGMAGGISIIDMNNMPILLTPNEYRDGAIRAMV